MTGHIDFTDLDALEAKLGRDALVLLKDQLLQRLSAESAPIAARVQSTAEMLLERRRAAFDTNHPEPTSGPIAEALRKGRERQARKDKARPEIEALGRFHIVSYRHRAPYWRIMDRLTGRIARFMLDGDRKPEWQTRIPSEADAIERVAELDRRMSRISAPPPPLILPDEPAPQPDPAPWSHLGTDMPESIWAMIAPLIPPPTRKGVVASRVVIGAIVFCLRTGFPVSSEIPRAAGCSGDTARKYLRSWQAAGIWSAIEAILREQLADGAGLPWHKLIPTSAADRRKYADHP